MRGVRVVGILRKRSELKRFVVAKKLGAGTLATDLLT